MKQPKSQRRKVGKRITELEVTATNRQAQCRVWRAWRGRGRGGWARAGNGERIRGLRHAKNSTYLQSWVELLINRWNSGTQAQVQLRKNGRLCQQHRCFDANKSYSGLYPLNALRQEPGKKISVTAGGSRNQRTYRRRLQGPRGWPLDSPAP